MSQQLNPLSALDNIKSTYRNYVGSFQEFKNPAIKKWVEEKVKDENLLYKGPFIQLNRRFEKGDSFEDLVKEKLLHPDTPTCFTTDPGNSSARPVSLHKHQSKAIRSITAGNNTIISTGTGSGKSFCFGIPVVSSCLEMQDKGIKGIKAIFVYPMNALANSQYDDFAKRLHNSGIKIAIYTGDTAKTRLQGLQDYRNRFGRDPYDSELLSREEIQQTPPDILITNYVMLEYILTRFEDRKLFPIENEGVLHYLVLDEVHTYTGKKGADVAYLIRRIKQSTGTKNKLRCIGTSATVQDLDNVSSTKAITKFASELFGEHFAEDDVVGEHYTKLAHDPDALLSKDILITEEMVSQFKDTEENIGKIIESLTGQALPYSTMDRTALGSYLSKQKTVQFIENYLLNDIHEYSELVKKYNQEIRPNNTYNDCSLEITAAFLAGMYTKVIIDDTLQTRIVPKIHTFFSQGRDIKSCITPKAPHLNDAGEVTCPHCAKEKKDYKTFPLVFCRSCGQEYYSVEIQPDGTLIPHELGEEDTDEGKSFYLYPGKISVSVDDLPDNWITEKKHNIKEQHKEAVNYEVAEYCPSCNKIYRVSDKSHPPCICTDKVTVTIIPSPFMYCPSKDCSISYDKRVKKEFNKLFSFSTVGRSTATDVLVASILNNLPEKEKKIIAFTDNRQDTALQSAHINNIQKRMHFRRGMYHALKDQPDPVSVTDLRKMIYETLEKNKVLPEFAEEDPYGGKSKAGVNAYKDYLLFNAYLELGSTKQKTQSNLEDMGLLKVTYTGIDKIATDTENLWKDKPELMKLSDQVRGDFLTGFLDIMRYNMAINYKYLLDSRDFNEEVTNKLQPVVLFHNENINRKPIGYSDNANSERREATVLRFSSPNGNLVKWTKRALDISDNTVAIEIVKHVATQMQNIKRIVSYDIPYVGKLWMIDHEKIEVSVPSKSTCSVCKKCGKVHHFKSLNLCTGPSCLDMIEKDMSNKYFRKEYTKDFSEATFIHAEEHSGQIDGDTRKDLEVRFREKGDVNVIVCTPTMELGIDIGSLSAVYMRNVPPSPSNYAQRAGRAGRKSQSSIISTFCGVGMKRGPHDQYFYRYPKDIISGKISVPRFMLNNQIIVRSHIHSLIIESLEMKIPQSLSRIIDMQKMPTLPMYSDIDESISDAIDKNHINDQVNSNRRKIIDNIKQAMSTEIDGFDWFNDKYIEDIVDMFVADLDNAFNPFRYEYKKLQDEKYEVVKEIDKHTVDPKKKQMYRKRREAIENKLDKMQSGSDEYATYSYLSQQGFIPNYGFPTLTTSLSLVQRSKKGREEKDLVRDQSKALREYAPGNSVYFKGTRYVIKEARIKTEKNKIDSSTLMICDKCGTPYMNTDIASTYGCCQYCGANLSNNQIFNFAVPMFDQRAFENNGITSDEEERYRLGYKISSHYRRSGSLSKYSVLDNTDILMDISYDHDGKILELNQGSVSNTEDNNVNGFILCTACNRWITSKTQLKEHLDEKHNNKCWKGARPEDIVENIVLYTESKHDVITIDCKPLVDIKEDDYHSFYISLSEAIMQSLQIAMNIDVDELDSFLMPHPEDEKREVIVIYESAEGGAGILKALTETSTFRTVMKEGRKILHENDSAACQKACYSCLCNYYNQHEHENLNRNLVLPILKVLSGSNVQKSLDSTTSTNYTNLMAKCDSLFEKQVLEAIRSNGIRLPDDAQYLIVVDGVSIAKPDFVYSKEKSIAVFVDGPDHDKESVKKDDEVKRAALDFSGWMVFVIRHDDNIEEKLKELEGLVV